MNKKTLSHHACKPASEEGICLQVIQGGKKKQPPSRPNRFEIESIITRFRFHNAHLFTLALKSGISQHEIAWLVVAKATADAFENGMKAERLRQRLMPPMGQVA